MITYGRQALDEADIAAVVDVLQGDWLTQGPAVVRFEAALCAATGARHAVAVNSGSAALYAAYAALGLGPGKHLWTSPITFVATANAALMLGAEVDFVDVDPVTGNLCVAQLRDKLAEAQSLGTLPDVLVPVHLTGRSCAMQEIRALADHYGFRVVEDASHALGGRYQGEAVGSCRYADAVVFSFHPVKSITSGEGGAVMTNREDIAEAVREIRHHGITRDPRKLIDRAQPDYHHEQHRLGFNFRLSDIHSALGASQLGKLESFMLKRRQLAATYHDGLAALADRFVLPPADTESAWHLYALRCPDRYWRDTLFKRLLAAGIRTAVHYAPVYSQPWYRQHCSFEALPGAETWAGTALSLPLHVQLGDQDVARVCALVSIFDGRE